MRKTSGTLPFDFTCFDETIIPKGTKVTPPLSFLTIKWSDKKLSGLVASTGQRDEEANLIAFSLMSLYRYRKVPSDLDSYLERIRKKFVNLSATKPFPSSLFSQEGLYSKSEEFESFLYDTTFKRLLSALDWRFFLMKIVSCTGQPP